MTLNKNTKKWQIQLDVVYELMSEQLNNEESIGNSSKSRTQVDQHGNIRNKISGPNTKHNIVAKLYQLVDDKSQLCSTCRLLSPLKNGKFPISDEDVELLSVSGQRTKGCVICDAAGFLNAETGGSEKRESVFNVSDAIAEVTGTRTREMHSRLDSAESATVAKGGDESESSKNMIFYEENRNSTYHQSVVIDLDRVGFDDHKQIYVLEKEELKERIKATVKATLFHFMDIQGANMSVHKPHVIRLEGSVRELTDSQFINVNYSTMSGNYLDVQKLLDKDMKTFNNPAELSDIMESILNDKHMDEIIERNIEVVKKWKEVVA